MNPFLQSAVATPLPPDEAVVWSKPGPQAPLPPASAPAPSASPVAPCPRSGLAGAARPRWCRAARSLAVAAALGLGVCQGAAAQGTAGPGVSVNANVATAEQLETIKGIGPKTAQSIVRERERSGPFDSFQDFAERIRGIGPKRSQSLRAAGLTVDRVTSMPGTAGPLTPAAATGSALPASALPVGVTLR